MLSLIMCKYLTNTCFSIVFEKYDPNFMAASLDEAHLDITEVCKERGMSCGEVC
jgi:nucleotidyltransferase/DNA polymerase involved in DNA repair